MQMITLLDVGACHGEFTERWLEDYPDGNVICVEPDPVNVETLGQKFNADPRVQILACAVSQFHGTQKFYRGTSCTNGSLLESSEAQRHILNKKGGLETFDVECLTFGDIIAKYSIDMETCIIKLDVEGLEHVLLCDLLDADLLPFRIYMEDGCRKVVHKPEWSARIRFHHLVEEKRVTDQIFLEQVIDDPCTEVKLIRKTSSAGSEYCIGYVPIKSYYSFKSLKNPQWALDQFEEEGINALVRVCEQSESARNLIMHPALEGMALWFKGQFLNRIQPITLRHRDVDNDLDDVLSKTNGVFGKLMQISTKKSDLVWGVPRLLFIGIDRDAPADSMLVPLTIVDPWDFTSVESISKDFLDGYSSLNKTAEFRYSMKPRFHPALKYAAYSHPEGMQDVRQRDNYFI